MKSILALLSAVLLMASCSSTKKGVNPNDRKIIVYEINSNGTFMSVRSWPKGKMQSDGSCKPIMRTSITYVIPANSSVRSAKVGDTVTVKSYWRKEPRF
jgi:hypothetical protein